MSKYWTTGIFALGLLAAFTACSELKEPTSVSTHPGGWTDPQSTTFHGKMVVQSVANAQNCGSCHGQDYSGGTSGVSCTSSGCHQIYPHDEGFANGNSPNFHGKFIGEMLAWDILPCQQCHGSDYSGNGFEKKNCLACHTEEDGPEACNLCHGSTDNFAPPEDLLGNVETTAVGVGAHQTHLTDTTLTTSLLQECSHCHIEPSTYSDPGHIDNPPLPAELSFSPLASDSSRISPSWNHETATCGNVYCHGAFEFRKEDSAFPWGYADSTIVGNNAELLWTAVGAGQATCGTCHDLPPKGHVGIAEATCNVCHGRVVDADFNITNKDLHINGKIEVF